jgi:glycosyltransferase involved in cell wall biosynthesis
VITDLAKRVLRKSRLARKVFKGLKYLKHHGIVSTLKRIFGKRDASLGAQGLSGDVTALLEEQRCNPLNSDLCFSILVPLYNTDEQYLTEMIRSVQAQTYPEWELCLADGSDEAHAYVERVVLDLAKDDPRIKYKRLEQNRGISENTNECAKMATGDYIGFLDHDDLLSPMALYLNAATILETQADVLYSDEDHLSLQGEHCFPFRKPDWSPDLLYSQMYVCHFTTVKKSLFDELGGFCSDYDGSQDYDLMLRLSEKTQNIVHIPVVLYTWRECETSTAANADAKPYAHDAGRRALDAHLKRKYGESARADDGAYTFVFDARFALFGSFVCEFLLSCAEKLCLKSVAHIGGRHYRIGHYDVFRLVLAVVMKSRSALRVIKEKIVVFVFLDIACGVDQTFLCGIIRLILFLANNLNLYAESEASFKAVLDF